MDFFESGGALAPCPPLPTPMDPILEYLVISKLQLQEILHDSMGSLNTMNSVINTVTW